MYLRGFVFLLLASATCRIAAETQINDQYQENQDRPDVARLGVDKVVITWTDTKGSSNDVYAEVLNTDGTTFVSDFLVNGMNNTDGKDQTDPTVTAIGNDKFLIAWESEHITGTKFDIFAKIYNADGSVLVDEFQVNNHTDKDQANVAVTAVGSDKIFLAWDSTNQDGEGDGIFATMISLTGEVILPEFQVNTSFKSHQDYASVAAVGNDKILIAWESKNEVEDPDPDNRDGVYATLLSITGETLLAEFRANNNTDGEQDTVEVVGIDDDKFLIVWESDGGQDGDREGVFARAWAINGDEVWPETQINTVWQRHQDTPDVTYLGGGKVFIAWESWHARQGEVFGRIMSIDDENFAPEFRLNSESLENQDNVRVTVLTPDLVFAAWVSSDQDGNEDGIFGRFIAVSEELPEFTTAEFRVNVYTTSEQDAPVVAPLDGGLVFAAWESYGEDSSNWGIFATIITYNGTSVVAPFQVNEYSSGEQDDVRVAAIGGDKIVVVWESQNGKRDVFFRVYDSAGNTIVYETRVNNKLDNQQSNPTVASLGSDKFVVAWESMNETSRASGVFATIMDVTGATVVPEFRLHNYEIAELDEMSVVSIGADKILFVYELTNDENKEDIYATLISITGEEILPEWRVHNWTKSKIKDQKYPAAAAVGADKFVIAWESDEQDGSHDGVFATVMDVTGTVILAEFQVNTFEKGDQDGVSVTAIDEERVLIAWETGSRDQDGDDDGVFARIIYLSGQESLPEFRVSDETLGEQEDIQITGVGGNKVFAIWESGEISSDSDSDDDIFARLLVFDTPASAPPCDEIESNICHFLGSCTSTLAVHPVPSEAHLIAPGVSSPAASDGAFACGCFPEQLGHGYGASGCSTIGWTVRVLYQSRGGLAAWEVADLLELMGGLSCERGSAAGCDHIFFQWHDNDLAVNLLFPASDAGKAAAEAAAATFNAAGESARRAATYPPWVDPEVGARVYAWVAGSTADPIRVPPAGMEVQSVAFEPACAATGCWVIDVAYTTGSSDVKLQTFNSFYIPYAVGSDDLSFDYDYSDYDVLDSFEPANFPCRLTDYLDSSGNVVQSLPDEVTACCFGVGFDEGVDALGGDGSSEAYGVLGNYRVTTAFEAYVVDVYDDLCPSGGIVKDTTPKPEDKFPDGVKVAHHADDFLAVGQKFVDMPISPGVTDIRPVDAIIGMYAATIKLDEKELRTKAGLLRGTVGVEHTVDTFLGFASFQAATTTYILDPVATQSAIHLEKTSFFTVSTHGVNDYTFLEYVNMRLVTVYKQDADFSDGAGEVLQDLLRTNSSGSADYVQVTFTLGEKYEINSNSALVPLDSVRAGKGTFLTDAAMSHKCKDYADPASGFPTSAFDLRMGQTECAPGSTMCQSPSAIPDQFVAFNVPLGVDYLPAAASDLSANIFVDLVVSATVKDAHRTGPAPGAGGDPDQVKTTLSASIPVVAGGVNIFCDGLVGKTDLRDVADVDIILGSANSSLELTRLLIKEDIASTQLDPQAATEINSASIEAGLMTLVLQGNSSYFGPGNSALSSVSMELEDVITIHIMDSSGSGEGASVVAEVEDLLEEAPDDNSDTNGLITSGYYLNKAVYFDIDRSSQRAHLEPSAKLLEICPFNPARPSATDVDLETCITRRDVQYRGYPARLGSFSTAMEICANVVDGQGVGTGCVGAACCSSTANEEAFFTTFLRDSDYAKTLATNFATTLAAAYDLNQRFRRAYWINPGYEWTPTQTGGTPIFSVSQKLFMFALITLDEGVAADDGEAGASVSLPAVRRRMLLQAGSNDGLKDAQAGVGGEVLSFETSVATMMASAYEVPADRVATFKLKLQLTQDEACFDPGMLQSKLRDTMEDYVTGFISQYLTLQVTSLSIDRAGVECRRRRCAAGRALLATYTDATAEVNMLVVFAEGATSQINVAGISQAPGVVEFEAVALSPKVAVVETRVETPAPSQGSGNTALIAGICGGVGGAVLVAAAAVVWFKKRESRVEEPVVRAISADELKSQLQCEL